MSKNSDDIRRFLEVSMRLASLAEEQRETKPYIDEIGLGYRAFTSIVKNGIKAVLDLQTAYYDALDAASLAKVGEEEMREFMTDMFSDEAIETINDELKEQLHAYIQNELLKEESKK